MATVATVNTIAALLDTALAAENWSSAITLALRLKAAIIAVGEQQMADRSFKYSPGDLDDLVKNLKQRQASATTQGVQRATFKYVNPGTS